MSIDAYHQKYGKMLDPKEVSVTLPDGRVITFETGRIAKQARGAAVAKMGDAFVLSTVCYGEEKEGDFFPLTVEYREKAYAAGRLPGGYNKREAGRPSDEETLSARIIDRPIRPMFPENFTREVQVIVPTNRWPAPIWTWWSPVPKIPSAWWKAVPTKCPKTR